MLWGVGLPNCYLFYDHSDGFGDGPFVISLLLYFAAFGFMILL